MVGQHGLLRRVVAAAVAVLPLAVVTGLAGPVSAASPRLAPQWHLESLGITEAHRVSTGAGVVVAVLDTGVHAGHPDLVGQVLDGRRMLGTDDRGKIDERNHGTGVAGLIAAKGGGAGRALGVAPGAKILPVTVATNTFGGSDLPESIRYAVDHGAKVINVSNGGPKTSTALTDAIRYAQSRDVVVVAAAGNSDQTDRVLYPARLPGVLAVAATDRNGVAWSGGVRGAEVAITAPGTEISTTAGRWLDQTEGGYLTVPGGTSAAAPLVAGTAALVRARYPELSAAEVINRLVRTARDAGPPGRDERYGFGRLDPVAALTAEVPPAGVNPLGSVAGADETPAAAPESSSGGVRGHTLLLAGGAGLVGLVLVAVLVVVLLLRRRSKAPPAR